MQRIMSKVATSFLSVPLAIGASGAADAQAVRGDFGARSEASIRISVSVAPRFQGNPSTSLVRNGPVSASAQTIPFHSNAPGLRYSVSVYPAKNSRDDVTIGEALSRTYETDAAKPNAAGSEPGEEGRILFLIIPD